MSNQTSETCSTIYVHCADAYPQRSAAAQAAGACSGSEKILFFDLPYLSSQSMCFVRLSENGGGEPVPTLCECKPRPSTRLPTDESNLLIMLSLPPIPTLLPTPRILIVARSFVVLSLGANQGLSVRAVGLSAPPPQISLELTARSEIRIGCSVSIVTTKCTASLHPSLC